MTFTNNDKPKGLLELMGIDDQPIDDQLNNLTIFTSNEKDNVIDFCEAKKTQKKTLSNLTVIKTDC